MSLTKRAEVDEICLDLPRGRHPMYIWRREGTENSATHFTFHRCNRNNKVAAVMTPVHNKPG